jgi:Zn-dependent oligopeptidase
MVFNATTNHATQAGLDNSPVVARMLTWQQQKASLLGFKGSFAQLKFARMVGVGVPVLHGLQHPVLDI